MVLFLVRKTVTNKIPGLNEIYVKCDVIVNFTSPWSIKILIVFALILHCNHPSAWQSTW